MLRKYGATMIIDNPAWLVSYFRTFRHNIAIPMSNPIQICRANSNRVMIALSSANSAYSIVPGVPIPNDLGLVIPTTASPYIIKYADWGGVVGGEWWALGALGLSNLTITEVVYYPPE